VQKIGASVLFTWQWVTGKARNPFADITSINSRVPIRGSVKRTDCGLKNTERMEE